MRQLLIGCGLVALALVAVSAYALWQDGKNWAATQKPPRWAPVGIANPGYLNPDRFQWTTPAVLRDYARSHHSATLKEIQQGHHP